MKVVLDTNALLVSIPRKSFYRTIFDALLKNKFDLLVSNEILSEYEEIISNKANQVVSSNIIELLLSLKNVKRNEIFFHWNLINQDADDNKYVDCAIAGNADVIVTNDKHFNVLKKLSFPKVKVISIEKFLELIKSL